MSIQRLFKKKYNSLNTIEVSRSALLHNYEYLSKLSRGNFVAPVLKSNAYGHGLQLAAKVLDTVGAPFFCVDSLYEAYELRKIDIKTQILIMGYTNPENLKAKKLPFSFAVYDKETAIVFNNYQQNARIHIFVDTGMNREGVKLPELREFLDFIKTLHNLIVEGVMSHFAASDQYKNSLTIEQMKNFSIAQEMFEKAGIHPKWIHLGNSAACLLPKHYKGKIGNLTRVGIAIYGIGGEVNDTNLRPALRVLTSICQIKHVHKGEKIGYDFSYTVKEDMTISVLPYGYYDGMDRRLSNKGFVSIDGVFCPILGRVSMNITTVDVSNVPNAHVGQQVIIYSDDPLDKNSIVSMSVVIGTIERDLLVRLSESTKRIIVT